MPTIAEANVALPTVALIRIVAVASVFVARHYAPDSRFFEAATLAVAFGHYALALLFARGRVWNALKQPVSAIVLVVLTLSSVVPLYLGATVFAWFGFHHMINETYTPRRQDGSFLISGVRRPIAALLHGLVFACLYKSRTLFTTPLFWGLFAAAGVVYVVYLAAVLRIRRQLTAVELLEHLFGETLAIGMVFASFYFTINLIYIAGYHFAFWMLYPAVKMRAPQIAGYATITIVVTAAAFIVSPLGPPGIAMTRESMYALFSLFTFVHTQMSLVLSGINPTFLTRWVYGLGRPLNAA